MKSNRSNPVYLLISLIFITSIIFVYVYSGSKNSLGIIAQTDGNTYLSFINQAKEGHLLFTNMFTSEEVPYILFKPTYLIAGWVSYITKLPNVWIYHLFRILGIILFIFFLNKLISLYFKKESHINLTLFICIFASGIGFFFKFLTLFGIKQFGSIDLWVTDANNFLILLSHPHTIFSIAFMTASVYYFLKWNQNLKLKYIIISGLFSLILGFEHLFDVITIYFAIGFLMLDNFIINKKIDWKKIFHLFLFGIITIGPFIYNYALFTYFPSFSAWNQQNMLETPKFLHVIFGYGLMFAALIFTLGHYFLNNIYKKTRFEIRFLVYWILATFILIYSPFNIQRRFLEGLHIPFGIITGIFILTILPVYLSRILNKKLLPKFVALFVIVMLPTNVYLYFYQITHLDNGRGEFPYSVNTYLYPEENEALQWLAKNSKPDEAVLSTYNIGNYIPAYMNRRVYLGHWAQTIDFDRKAKEVNDFYKEGKPLSNSERIRYIWYGADEKMLNKNFFPPYNFDIVFQNSKVIIFKAQS